MSSPTTLSRRTFLIAPPVLATAALVGSSGAHAFLPFLLGAAIVRFVGATVIRSGASRLVAEVGASATLRASVSTARTTLTRAGYPQARKVTYGASLNSRATIGAFAFAPHSSPAGASKVAVWASESAEPLYLNDDEMEFLGNAAPSLPRHSNILRASSSRDEAEVLTNWLFPTGEHHRSQSRVDRAWQTQVEYGTRNGAVGLQVSQGTGQIALYDRRDRRVFEGTFRMRHADAGGDRLIRLA